MRTARPAARPPHPFFELRAQPFDMLPPRLIFLDGDGPADPLVTRERRYVFPSRQCLRVGRERLSEISRETMYDSSGDLNGCHRTSRRLKDQASDTRVQLGFRDYHLRSQDRRPGERKRLGNGDNDFAANMAGLDMTNSFCYFAQTVGAVDNGTHGSSFN